MKNNQGFTLIGLMAIAAMLSIITVAGIAVSKYRANKAATESQVAKSAQLVANLNASTGEATLQGSGNAQFQNLPNPDLTDPNNPNNPDSPLNPDSPNNPNNPNSPLNPNNPNNSANPNYSPPPCPQPCHNYTDPDSNVTTCLISKIDTNCLGAKPNPIPAGCTYVEEGPGDPHYQPAPNGDGATCPFTPNCTPPYVPSPRYHECRCPGDVSDCIPFGNPPGGVKAPMKANLQNQN